MSDKIFNAYNNVNVLVTGGLGFIGSHLVDRLNALGARVLVIDNFISSNELYIVPSEVSVYNIDIRDKVSLAAVLREFKPRHVFHLAAYSRTQGSEIDKELVYSTNINGTINLLELLDATITRSIVYSASSTFYGNTGVPNFECNAPDFGTHYAISKFCGEEIVRLSLRDSFICGTSLRYFSVYGERQPTEGVYALVLGKFLSLAQRKIPLEVHGDGEQRRDFVHVTDVVEANLRAAIRTGNEYKVLNIGTGKNYSIMEIATAISNNLTFKDSRPGDARETMASLELTVRVLNWYPPNRLWEYINSEMTSIRE